MGDYLQHGRRHAAGGSDPIPGIGAGSVFPWIVARGSVVVSAGTAASSNYVDLNLYATGDTSVFGIATGTGGLATINGITAATEGVYRVWATFEFSAATNGDTLIAETDSTRVGAKSHWLFQNDQLKDETRVVYSTVATTGAARVQYVELFYVGGVFDSTTPPTYLAVSGRSPAGNSFILQANVLVEQLSTSYTTNGFFGVFP